MAKYYPMYYSGSPNFGDAINPILYKNITGRNPDLVLPDTEGKILSCGSIAHVARPFDIIWGAGLMQDMELKCDVTTQVLAVRGPLTAELLYEKTKKFAEIYCDPGLLIYKYIIPSIKAQRVGILPHYTDIDIVTGDLLLNKHYINIMSGVEEVIKRVTTCNYIITSALHGLVCAEAYGIPALWVEFSDNVAGKGFKFEDYYWGTCRQPPKPLDWRNKRNLDEAIEILKYSWQPPECNIDLMLKVCPFNWGVTDYKRWNFIDLSWKSRNEDISKMVDEGARVIEFGSGNQDLRNMLPKSCTYTPSDIIKRTEDTVVCDLNTGIYPDLSCYDTIILSGVLEYIYDIKKFVDYVKTFTNIKTFICSYIHGTSSRDFNGWVNNLTEEELISLFDGFNVYGNGNYKFTR